MSDVLAVPPSVSKTPLPLDADDLATVCVLCSHNCGLRVDVRGGEIVKVRPDESNPITHGYVCNKGFSIPHYVRHEDRVTHPLRRRPDGTFERIPWDTAIGEIAARLTALRNAHSPRAIGLVGIGGQGNHMDAPYGLGFLRTLGSKRWFNAFAQEKTQHLLVDQWMFDSSPTSFLHHDMGNTEYLVVLGTNPKISHRGHAPTKSLPEFTAQPGRTLVVVDPRETETTQGASRHLRVKPGTDAWLLLGMAAVIARGEGLADEAFVRTHTKGFEALQKSLQSVDVGEMAKRCGVPADDIVRTATELARARTAAFFYDLGVEQIPFSTLVSYLLRVILVLTGNLGRPGGEVFYETLLPPARDPGRKREPERALASGVPAIAAMGNFGMFSPSLVPEEILLDHPERLRALIVEGANPLLSYSDTRRWLEAREQLDLLVVIDPAMTETARIADYVLPVPVGYEKWEIANFPKRFPEIYVQVRPPVVPGPEDALPEPEIYARLSEAMDLFGEPPAELHDLARNAGTAEGAMAFLARLQELAAANDPRTAKERSIFWAYRTLGPELAAPSLVAVWLQCFLNAMLRTENVLRALGAEWQSRSPFEIGLELFQRILDHPEGVEIARLDPNRNLEDNVGTPDRKIRIAPEPMLGEISRCLATGPATDAEYPFVLAAGLRTRWTANTIQRDPKWRKGRGPHCTLHLSPADAGRLGVTAGDGIRIVTRRGTLDLPVEIDPKVQDGHVWMPNGFGMKVGPETVGGNQNELTDVADRDPFTAIPHHRTVACRLEPVRRVSAA